MIRVGTAGWSYRDWEGIVYPRPKPKGFHPLRHLARSFDCVEINSSFYACPSPDAATRWVREVEDHPTFRFTAKLLDAFTHRECMERHEHRAQADRWLAGIEPLVTSGRLAAVLVQFPHSFRPSPASLDRLGGIKNSFGHLPLVLELRHRAWFQGEPLRALEHLRISLARIDLPEASDHPPAAAPTLGPIGYLRLHGRNSETWFQRGAGRDQRYDYLYTRKEVGELARRARRIADGVDETYVITNNHFSGKAAVNALELLADLGGTAPFSPRELVDAYPRLDRIVRTDAPDTLF